MKNKIIDNIFDIINNSEYKFYNTLFNAENLNKHSEINIELNITHLIDDPLNISKILLNLILQKILYTYKCSTISINVEELLTTKNILFCTKPLKSFNIEYDILPNNNFLGKCFIIDDKLKFCDLENYIYDIEIINNILYLNFPIYEIEDNLLYEINILKTQH